MNNTMDNKEKAEKLLNQGSMLADELMKQCTSRNIKLPVLLLAFSDCLATAIVACVNVNDVLAFTKVIESHLEKTVKLMVDELKNGDD